MAARGRSAYALWFSLRCCCDIARFVPFARLRTRCTLPSSLAARPRCWLSAASPLYRTVRKTDNVIASLRTFRGS